MSIRTHVVGLIRLDDLRIHHSNLAAIIRHWQSNVPTGSEGGKLTVIGYENPDMTCLSAYSISVFGDLRDFGSSKQIVTWLNDRSKNQIISQGICLIETEGEEPLIWRYEGNDATPENPTNHLRNDQMLLNALQTHVNAKLFKKSLSKAE